MKKMNVLVAGIVSALLINFQSFSMEKANEVPERKIEPSPRNALFDQQAELKRMRRYDLKTTTIHALAAQQQIQGRCDVSCGCLGMEQTVDCLSAGHYFAFFGALWQLIRCGKR